MKDKLKQFFKEKKELLIFIGILSIIFTSVIVIANLTLSDDENPVDGTVVEPIDTGSDVVVPSIVETPSVALTFGLPVSEEALLIRAYYDPSKSVEELEIAIIMNDNHHIESTGVSYANKDDSLIEVYSIYEGTVTSVTESESYGIVVTIDYGNTIVATYSSLVETSLKSGDTVNKGTVIGKGGTCIFDKEASNHVTLEVKVAGMYVDPEDVFNKEAALVSALIDGGK